MFMKIGFLGLGNMGTPMALRLLAAGHDLSVWNRTEGRTKPLLHEGAIAAATPAEAELDADTVITMLLDDAAYEEVFFGIHRLIDSLSPGLLHILCSTISPALCERLAIEHANRRIGLVAAPVLGTPSDAAAGQLSIIAAGADQVVARARPLLEVFALQITVVGKEPQRAFSLGNHSPSAFQPPS
jgi:3-hydroxyisobutyrate dehydrogenase-like beta-hydroxyacid dehydrogenase